jgi:hypothetical protein
MPEHFLFLPDFQNNAIRDFMRRFMPRELIEPHKGDKRYIRRGSKGQFTDKQVNVGRSLAADRKSKAKTVAKKGEGDRGDRRT